MAMKLKETEGKLEAERQLHAQRERLAEEARKARLEREKLDEERNQAVKQFEAANISLEEGKLAVQVILSPLLTCIHRCLWYSHYTCRRLFFHDSRNKRYPSCQGSLAEKAPLHGYQ